MLSIAVLEGRNLAACDSTGFSDPWAELRVEVDGIKLPEKYRTKTVPQSLNPVWNEVFTFAHENISSSKAVLKLKLWDQDKLGRDFMGTLSLPLAGFKRTEVTDDWFRLEQRKKGDNVSGEIHLKVKWGKFDKTELMQQEGSKELSNIPHKFKPHSAIHVAQCSYCLGVLWALSKAFKCDDCGYICHAACQDKNAIADDCVDLDDVDVTKKAKQIARTKTVINLKNLSLQGYISPGRLEDSYTLGVELGAGACGQVVAATHTKTNESVAVKIIEKNSHEDLEVLAREILVMKELHHPSIVNLMEAFESKDTIYLVMEKVGGGELFDRIVDNDRLPEKDAQHVTLQICSALQFCHDRGVAHRDLKPENVLLCDKTGTQVKLADFGLANAGQTTFQTYCGTTDYMAPEIMQGTAYDFAVDMWSLGVLSYVMMAGSSPFWAAQEAQKLRNIMEANFNYDDPEWKDVSDTAKSFIRRLIVKDPKSRMTATEALEHPWLKSKSGKY